MDPSYGSGPESPSIIYLKQKLEFGDIWTASQSMKECLETAARVAPLEMDVLILGETGAGKNLLAQAIHNASPRRDGPLVELNTAGIPQTLAENELFGHEPGAFTGAGGRRQGVFEQASGGTLFLDEIGDMPQDAQAKILSAVERKRVRRLGGDQEIDCDVRLICATNRDVGEAVSTGALREDLCYRLARCVLNVPSLRERLEDIPLLVERFIALDNANYNRAVTGVTQACMARLLDYPWPGNVRELRAKISFAVAICGGTELEPSHVFPEGAVQRALQRAEPAQAADDDDLTLATCLAAAERHQVAKVLTLSNWNITKAAELLAITRQTLRDRIQKYGLQKPIK